METIDRIKDLRRRGYSTVAIARQLGLSPDDVVSLINEKAHPAYEPTEEEIYRTAEQLRERTPRDPQGYPLGLTVEVTRASLMGIDRKGKGLGT